MTEIKTINITLDEYRELIEAKSRLEMVMTALYTDTELSWNGKAIKFDEDMLNAFLRLIDTDIYISELERLKALKRAMEEGKDGDI